MSYDGKKNQLPGEENGGEETLVSLENTESDAITSLQTEIASLKDQWMRAVAETENLRRRAERDREDALKYGATNFARDMLGVADNLERALSACPPKEEQSEQMASFVEGVELVSREVLNSFERHGITKVFPMNERFDPMYHQAMFEVEAVEIAPGMVINVMQPGYLIHGRLLRPALVGVTKVSSGKLDQQI